MTTQGDFRRQFGVTRDDTVSDAETIRKWSVSVRPIRSVLPATPPGRPKRVRTLKYRGS